MRTLLFLSRVCVLMNVMFLLFLAGQFNWLPVENSYLTGLIVTTGMFISPIFNVVLHPVLFTMLLTRRGAVGVPAWVIVFNFFCFVFQIFFFFFT